MAAKSVGPETTTRPAFVSAAGLRDRGWTPAMIVALLGVHDKQARNPRFAKAAPMKLFALARVVAAEQTAAFAEARDKAGKRVAVGEASAARRRTRLLAAIGEMVITIRPMPLARLHAASLAAWETDREAIAENADAPGFRDRLAVNYARHRLTTYDGALDEAARKPGAEAARRAIRQKVYDAIAARWPTLADECHRQMRRREGGAF